MHSGLPVVHKLYSSGNNNRELKCRFLAFELNISAVSAALHRRQTPASILLKTTAHFQLYSKPLRFCNPPGQTGTRRHGNNWLAK